MKRSYSILIFALIGSLASTAQPTDTIKVKVHDHVMTLYASGVGSPAIILEAGLGATHRTWQKVQPKLSGFSKVVSYDRPGYLNSDSCSKIRDAVTVAKELKEALTKAHIKPPYILTGWSLGGAFVRVFAGLFPKDVVGIVLVDPVAEEAFPRFIREQPQFLKEDSIYTKEVLASNRIGEKLEVIAFDSSLNQARISDSRHSTPTYLLIAAGKAPGGQNRDPAHPLYKIWIEELEKWGLKRPNTEYDIIRNSGHNIARDQPDTVVDAVRTKVKQYHAKFLEQSAPSYKKPEQLIDGIQTSTLKDEGIQEKFIINMQDSIANGNYTNIHSVLILRNNKLVYENYFPGIDVTRGIGNAGFKEHHRDSLHDIRSVTKSVVGTAILIAIAQGKIKSDNERVFDFFPGYARYDSGLKRQITIKHLLNMTSGLEWDEETISYTDTTNSERRMNNSMDATDFVLRQQASVTPGKKYNYSGGNTQLLAAIVEKSTGMTVEKFTEQYLFKPLGIETFTWVKIRDGKPSAASGLRMRSRDMAKIGLLYLNHGKWQGKQIIPIHLAQQSMKSQVSTHYKYPLVPHIGYSNQFWVPTEIINGEKVTWVQAQGNGGQIIIIDKQNNLVAVITAGNYNLNNLRKTSWDIYPDFIYPAVKPVSKKFNKKK